MVVGKNGDIKKGEWNFNGHSYRIISTQSTGKQQSVWSAIDEIKRDDGVIKKFTRKELKEHFK